MAVSAPTVTISEIEATAVITQVEASTVVTEVGTSVVATEIDASAVMTEVEATVVITEVEATAVISEIEATAVITEVEASAVITEVEASATISETQNIADDTIVINGNLDSNMDGWQAGIFTGGAHLEWSASGGGFTGSIHNSDSISGCGFRLENRLTISAAQEGWYHFSCDVNVITNSGGNVYFYFNPTGARETEQATFSGLGLATISKSIFVNEGEFDIEIQMQDVGAKEFYADNIILSPVKASDVSAVMTEVETTVIITE